MTIDDLLVQWAVWCAKRDDGGLGFAPNRLGVLMSGGVVAGAGNNSLPYGIDCDSVFATVDSEICRLPDVYRLVVDRHYRCIGDDKAKAKAFGTCVRTYYKYLADTKALLYQALRDKCASVGLTAC